MTELWEKWNRALKWLWIFDTTHNDVPLRYQYYKQEMAKIDIYEAKIIKSMAKR